MPDPQFTKGPWRIVGDREDELKVKGPADEYVADCADGFWSDEADGWVMAEESPANAHLIAAAPELYEALVQTLALAQLEFGNDDEGANAVFEAAKSALAKARGEA